MAKRNSQLVCQHLESISRKMLEEYQDVIRDFARGRNGIYALYRRGKLYYVGLASSLLRRLKGHLRNHHKGTWDRFSVYLTVGPQYMKEIESVLLRISDPPGNKVKGKFAKSENLLRKLKASYRQKKKAEEDELFGARKKRKGTKQRKPAKRAKEVKGRQPVLAKHIQRGMWIRTRYKGKQVKAYVRADGQIRCNGKLYQSPSAAGRAVIERGQCNGWDFWTYERAPGDWVPLQELR